MVRKAKSRLYKHSQSTRLLLPIPADLVKDSTFPFEPREEVEIEIDEGLRRLIVKKAGKEHV